MASRIQTIQANHYIESGGTMYGRSRRMLVQIRAQVEQTKQGSRLAGPIEEECFGGWRPMRGNEAEMKSAESAILANAAFHFKNQD